MAPANLMDTISQALSPLKPYSMLIFVGAILFALWLALDTLRESNLFRRIWRGLEENVLTNWRLVVLGLTGIVLSVASGWTTWDGMRNFTKEPVLSLMITFGIQGVMLIVAWLIGESFATGMGPARSGRSPFSAVSLTILGPVLVIGLGCVSAFGLLYHMRYGISSDAAMYGAAAAGSALLLLALVMMFSRHDVVSPYLQGLRVIVKNSVLWVMFLACMATSVFFSFDSLFAQIFPQDERKRAADIRAQNRVAGVVADIGALARKRRIEEAEALFTSKAWASYEGRLDGLVRLARQAPEEIQRHFEQRMREQQAQRARIQDDVAGAASQRVRLEKRRDTLRGDITRIKEQLPQLASETDRHKAALFQKEREITAMKAEVGGEAGGIGVTGKVGRGPKFRELQASLFRLNEEKKKIELQLRDWEQRLKSATEQVASSESELERLGGEIAKLKGREETGKRLIESARERQATVDAPRIDPTNMLAALEKARVEFRQKADAKGLATLQQVCSTMLGAIGQVPSLKDQSKAIDCDPGVASEAASRVFALNAGIVRYEQTCARGENLPSSGGTDALLTFAARCVQDSGLPGRDTAALRTTLNRIALDRDDKAHRFVVTWNAFDDGNKLAYLALAIAIAIDGLVFLSGLFGANAVRSPLSDVPSSKARSAKDLNSIIDNALLPARFENATLVLSVMQPIEERDGFTSEIILAENYDRVSTVRIRHVLNAGATIGAVRRADGHQDRYFIHRELYKYLAEVREREFKRSDDHIRAATLEFKADGLERTVISALAPDIERNASIVLDLMQPTRDPKNSYTTYIQFSSIKDEVEVVVRNVMNAGAAMSAVAIDGRRGEEAYFILPELYLCLSRIRMKCTRYGNARLLGSSHDGAPVIEGRGGRLSEPREAITQAPESRRITSGSHVFPDGFAQTPAHSDVPARELSRPLDEEALQGIRYELLRALEVEWRDYSMAKEAREHAGKLKKALEVLRVSGPTLWSYVQDEQRAMREAIWRTAERRKLASQGNPEYEQAIDQERADLEGLLPALMLIPGGAYERALNQLVGGYEPQAADGQLDVMEQMLYKKIKHHRDAIASIQSRRSSDWYRLAEIAESYTESMQPLN